MAADSSGDIVIKGGSCEIHFDDRVIKKDRKDPAKRKHRCDGLTITRIVIVGNQSFDSEDIPDGFKGTITISCSSKP
jgi:hypothetical protein